MKEPTTICGETIGSRRSLLASLWSLVTLLTVISFLMSFIFAMTGRNNNNSNYGDDDYYNYNNNNYNNNNEGPEDEQEQRQNDNPEVAVTSRALAFSALWTGVLAALMSVFGTVILGWQSPTGQYYTCCSPGVHRTTPLGLGSFIGSLLMLANLTLICAVLFGDFQITARDIHDGDERGGGAGGADEDASYGQRESRSSIAFSYLCLFLTVLYAGFAALTFVFANGVIHEYDADEKEELQGVNRSTTPHFGSVGYDGGYIGGERFDIGRLHSGPTGFVSPPSVKATEATMA